MRSAVSQGTVDCMSDYPRLYDNKVQLMWQPLHDATSYEIYRSQIENELGTQRGENLEWNLIIFFDWKPVLEEDTWHTIKALKGSKVIDLT